MKIALILTGHMRCWQDVYQNTYNRIIGRWDTDVYITTWDNEGYWVSPENDSEGRGVNKHSPQLDVNRVIEAYEPVKIEVLKQESFSPVFRSMEDWFKPYCKEIRPKNILSQFFLMERGLREIQNFLPFQYDAVIRMRPDLLLHEELPEPSLEEMHTIAHPNHEGLGVGDMYMAGDYWSMSDYCEKRLGVANLMKQTIAMNRFCPHMLTQQSVDVICKENDLTHRTFNINKTIMHSPNGQYKDYTP